MLIFQSFFLSPPGPNNLLQLPIIFSALFPISCFPAIYWFAFYPFTLPLDFSFPIFGLFVLKGSWFQGLSLSTAPAPITLSFPFLGIPHTSSVRKKNTRQKHCLAAGNISSSFWGSRVSLGQFTRSTCASSGFPSIIRERKRVLYSKSDEGPFLCQINLEIKPLDNPLNTSSQTQD